MLQPWPQEVMPAAADEAERFGEAAGAVRVSRSGAGLRSTCGRGAAHAVRAGSGAAHGAAVQGEQALPWQGTFMERVRDTSSQTLHTHEAATGGGLSGAVHARPRVREDFSFALDRPHRPTQHWRPARAARAAPLPPVVRRPAVKQLKRTAPAASPWRAASCALAADLAS